MFKGLPDSNRRVTAASAVFAVVTGLLLLSGSPATAATPSTLARTATAGHTFSDAAVLAGLQPAFVGNVYTGQVGPAGIYTPQFSGPVSTPEHPNPAAQYVHITAGDDGATVAKSLSVGTPQWTVPWVLGPKDTAVIPIEQMEMLGIENASNGTPGSFTVTGITGS